MNIQMATKASAFDDTPKSLREIAQKRILEEVVGVAPGKMRSTEFCLHWTYICDVDGYHR